MLYEINLQHITPVVEAIAAYSTCCRCIQPELLQAMVERDQVLNTGALAKLLVAAQLAYFSDVKATSALRSLEEDPEDEDCRSKLIKELTQLAQMHPDFTGELHRMADMLPSATNQKGAAIANYASNQGVQGTSYGPITINQLDLLLGHGLIVRLRADAQLAASTRLRKRSNLARP